MTQYPARRFGGIAYPSPPQPTSSLPHFLPLGESPPPRHDVAKSPQSGADPQPAAEADRNAQRKARLAASIFCTGNQRGLGPAPPQPADQAQTWARRREEDRRVEIGRRLSYLLRHGARQAGLPMERDGYVPLAEILKRRDFSGLTTQDITALVAADSKQRYRLREDQGALFICAQQGHSLEVPELHLQPITRAEDAPICIHGTFYSRWGEIVQSGLSPMTRQHIHFATQPPDFKGHIP
eukprot:EG_transcript_17569